MVFQAGFVGFVKTLLILAGIYYALKIIMRFLFPWMVKTFLKKQFSNYSNQQPRSTSNQEQPSSKKKNPMKDQLGEYVDYEEVSEND